MNIDTFLSEQLFYACIMGAAIGSVSAYLGSLMLTKRMSLMAGALGHLTLPGIAFALLLHIDVSLGALIFLAFGIVCIWLLQQKTQLPPEGLTALVFATTVSVAFIFMPHKHFESALLGDISTITIHETLITLVTAGIIFVQTYFIFSHLVLMSISQDLARVQGINTKITQLRYLIAIALMIALGVRIVGGLLTSALVAIPALTSKNISKNLKQYATYSLAFGTLGSVIGIITSHITGIPVGPGIILINAFFFVVSLFFTYI